jgi:ATP/maltotriose-dependent transcriptional regulator MalT
MDVPATGVADPAAAGHAALARADWAEARSVFEAEVAADEASAEAWEALSRAAWWQGDQEATFTARERAYRAYRRKGDPHGAARMAMWVASDHLDFRGDDAVASAWLRRAASLVDGHPPCAEQGYIALLEADIALLADGDPGRAAQVAERALTLARRVGDVGVEVVALSIIGYAQVTSGATEEGLRRLDEAAGLAVGEEFADMAAPGWALCHTVSACTDIGDFDRAAQWCRALHTWSAAWHARHFLGVCRTAYGEVLVAGGDWPSAEQELLSAVADLAATRPALAASSAVRLGRLRVRQGDLVTARTLFEAALPLPHAVVGLGELGLLAGDATAAVDAAERVLRRSDDASVLDRLPALELLARALAVQGDHGRSADIADEVEHEAAQLGTPYLRGRARQVRAQVLLAAGDHDGARHAAEDATDLLAAASAPFESAQARLSLAEALRQLGHGERADAEAAAAQASLALLGVPAPDAAGVLSPREADILRLVAQGLSDARISEQLFLSPHTVHRHVANIRTKLNVPSRAAAVAHATRENLL